MIIQKYWQSKQNNVGCKRFPLFFYDQEVIFSKYLTKLISNFTAHIKRFYFDSNSNAFRVLVVYYYTVECKIM